MSENKPRPPAEVADGYEAEPEPKSLETVNLGQAALGRLGSIRWLANPDQIPAGNFEPDFESGSEQLQAQMSLVAEILHSAQQQEVAYPRGPEELDQRIQSQAVELSVAYAAKARESGNPDEVEACLLSGLIIDYNLSGYHQGEFVHRAVGAGLASELIAAADAGRNLILNEGDPDFISWGTEADDWQLPPFTPASVLRGYEDLLEIVTARRLEVDGLGLQVREPLSAGDIDNRLADLDGQEAVTAALSPEISQNHPELQERAIKNVLREASSEYGFYGGIDDLSQVLIDFSAARPDLFETGLKAEFAQIRQQRLIGYNYKVNSSWSYNLDSTAVELWIAGRTDLAASLLTASSQEAPALRWAVEQRVGGDFEQAQAALGEMIAYVNQQRQDLSNRIDQYIAGFVAADPAKQDQLRGWLGQLLSEQNFDSSTDPEHYFQLVASAAPKLLARADIGQLDWVANELRRADGPGKLGAAELISRDSVVEIMTDEVFGPNIQDELLGRRAADPEGTERLIETLLDPGTKTLMTDEEFGPWLQQVLSRRDSGTFITVIEAFGRNPNLEKMLRDEAVGPALREILRSSPRNLEPVVNMIGSPEFCDLAGACQIDSGQDWLVAGLGRTGWRGLPAVDRVVEAFSANPGLSAAVGQLPESQRTQFFLQAVVEPDLAGNLSALLADSDALSLLAKNDEKLLFDSSDWLGWPVDSISDNSRGLLKAFELVESLEARGAGELAARIPGKILYAAGRSYPEAAEELEALLADDNVDELLAGSTNGAGVLTQLECFDVLLGLDPELRPAAAAELLAGLKLLSQPAVLENPSLRGHVGKALLNAPEDKYRQVARRLAGTLEQPRELWKTLYLFSTEIAGIDPGRDESNIHPIAVLPKLQLKLAETKPDRLIDGVAGFEPVDLADLPPDNLRALLADSDMTDEELRRLAAIPFNWFRPDVKRQIYAHRLFETVAQTRSAEAKAAADGRNRWLVGNRPEIFAAGDFIHSTSPEALGGILQDGNLAGESRRLAAAVDAFPFNVDFSVIEQAGPTPNETIDQTISASYGSMTLVYAKHPDSRLHGSAHIMERGVTGQGGLHGLVLGGAASTEISGAVLRQPTEPQLAGAKRAIVENGFYIPLYDGSGQLMLSPQEYDDLRDSYNLDRVGVDAIEDNAMSVENQIGSNSGSEYYITTAAGQQRYYVKFGGSRNQEGQNVNGTDHVWTEYLTDEIYRRAGVAVPETKIVQIEGRIGKASRWLGSESVSGAEITNLDGGFVIDAWLGNWDIVYNQANVVPINGAAYRIDNGNGLDMRAQGGRKPAEAWTGVVGELEHGQDMSRLALGMRQEYPGLTAEDFAGQVDRLASQFPDAVIDQLVDSIRRSRDDRAGLKQTLKARRDYIVSQRDRIVAELSSEPAGYQPLAMAA